MKAVKFNSLFLKGILSVLLLSLSVLYVNASEGDSNNVGVSEVNWMSNYEFWLGLSVLIFGLVILIIEVSLIKKIGVFSPEQSIKLVAVTLIIISTLFIITSGFDSSQIAPAMGLFGTIAGYMLGKSQNGDKNENNKVN
ncbi:TPA: hypothetical protein NPP35_004419 [Klebsiella variicola subsp. variicola]|nr:hypothetical protein [Klebsiella variicola subsp. variicola]HED2783237.1 hypothetical protein [Klebsiella variicola subsp. variicola]